jgi:hypothetical protein
VVNSKRLRRCCSVVEIAFRSPYLRIGLLVRNVKVVSLTRLCAVTPHALGLTQMHPNRPLEATADLQGSLDAFCPEGISANFVASKMPTPIGVEIEALYGTKSRVPPRGASQISVSCCAARVSDKKMLRVVSGDREELGRAHHDLSLVAFGRTSRAETLEG